MKSSPRAKALRSRAAKLRALDVTTCVLEAEEHPEATWVLLSAPYSRPRTFGLQHTAGVLWAVERGLLERGPTNPPIYRCTEKGEEVAYEILAFFGALRV